VRKSARTRDTAAVTHAIRPGYGRRVARQNRIQLAGAYYHVGNRGNARATVFGSDEDRHQFVATLADVIERYDWRCSSYCLMTNHYHLTLTTPSPNLGAGMGRLNQLYAQWYNRRHDRVGHLFQERYWSHVIETEAHLARAARYIVDNPVRAGLCARPEHWRWSSARAAAGRVPVPAFLDLSQLGLD
jgi:putative transposase